MSRVNNAGVNVSFSPGSAAIAVMTVTGALVVGLIDWLVVETGSRVGQDLKDELQPVIAELLGTA